MYGFYFSVNRISSVIHTEQLSFVPDVSNLTLYYLEREDWILGGFSWLSENQVVSILGIHRDSKLRQ